MEEQEYLEMYLKELKALPKLTEEEEKRLTEACARGEEAAGKRLAEGHLRTVLEIAEGFLGKGVPMADLIQEGNLGLLEGISTYEAGTAFREHIRRSIRNAMEDALEEEGGEKAAKERLVSVMNEMDEATRSLAKELGREATLAEVAEKMGLPEDEVHRLMREALNAIQ